MMFYYSSQLLLSCEGRVPGPFSCTCLNDGLDSITILVRGRAKDQ